MACAGRGVMQRLLRGLLRFLIRATLKPLYGGSAPIGWQRVVLDSTAITTRRTPGVALRVSHLGGVPCDCIEPPGAAPRVAILYLHGGGYCIGSPRTHRPITTALAAASGATVWVPDYRLAPEHPFPAALDDARTAYRELCEEADRIVVAGDSAGGGLALALAAAARDGGGRRADALALISPWVDLAGGGASQASRAQRDPMLTPAGLARWAALYAGGRTADPRVSPLSGDLAGLPPVLIEVGTEEILADDSARLRERLMQAGVECRLREFAGLWHDFPMHARVLADADRAIAEIAAFSREALQRRPAPGVHAA